MRFTKMQACGNDFIVLNGFEVELPNPGETALKLCDRHFGIGADGLLLICPGKTGDVRMRIINADGGEVNMCGNGIRCAAKYAYDHHLCHKKKMAIETGAGILDIIIDTDRNDNVAFVTVDMGIPDTLPEHYPLLSKENTVTIDCDGHSLHFFCVNTGVPHAVTFDLLPDNDELARIGRYIEHHPLFPQRTNVCFGRIDSSNEITVNVWERGCGITLACGTGSCAVLYAANALGYISSRAAIKLPGGTLHDTLLENGHITMTGPAAEVFEGNVNL